MMTRPGVYLIKGRFGKEAGKIMGVCEAPPQPTHDSTVEEGMLVLQLWCGRQGLSEMAVANYTAEFAGYIPFDSLSRTFKPIIEEKDIQPWYVAEFNACVVVRAHSAAGAIRRASVHPAMEGKADRIRVVRHATPDEVELHETMPKRLAEIEAEGRTKTLILKEGDIDTPDMRGVLDEEEMRRRNAKRIGDMSS